MYIFIDKRSLPIQVAMMDGAYVLSRFFWNYILFINSPKKKKKKRVYINQNPCSHKSIKQDISKIKAFVF